MRLPTTKAMMARVTAHDVAFVTSLQCATARFRQAFAKPAARRCSQVATACHGLGLASTKSSRSWACWRVLGDGQHGWFGLAVQ